MAKGVPEHGDASVRESPPQDSRLIVKWIELQPSLSQARYAQERLDSLLLKASQPWHSSKNACIELCYFVEQCRSSESSLIREVAFAEYTSLNMFNFYIEGDEKTQSRQTKQAIELVASLIVHHPEEKIVDSIKESILLRLVSILAHQAAQPLVKSSFRALDLLLSKKAISPEEVIATYEKSIFSKHSAYNPKLEGMAIWDLFISDMFDWMTLPNVAPAAGKCLVTLFGQIRSTTSTYISDGTLLWQRWIRNGLDKDSSALENVKNYLFPPLFKLDRSGSIHFLEDLNKQKPISDLKSTRELNAHSLLQLSAIDAGKKAGLVAESNTIESYKATNKTAKLVVLQEDTIGSLTTCEIDTARSLAFSVLVASPSPLRPFTTMALDILESRIGILYADTDAKFRTDTLSNTRKLIERLRGTTAFLNRELGSLSLKYGPGPSTSSEEEHSLYDRTRKLLQRHERFIEWYLEFLLGELVPTVSYQRHITALKAIELLLHSGILNSSLTMRSLTISNNATTWAYRVNFFTTRAMRLLLDLLMDPFEDVRISSAAILKLASVENFAAETQTQEFSDQKTKLVRVGNEIPQHKAYSDLDHQVSENQSTLPNVTQAERGLSSLTALVARAEDLAKRTGRADYGDGVARCYELLYTLLPSTESRLKLVKKLVTDLETKIHIAEQDLANAVLDAPVHGTFAALNLVWEMIDLTKDFRASVSHGNKIVCKEWEDLQVAILSLCSRIWNEVKDVLCSDSPEGHLPRGLDEIDGVDTKDILSYSFRAIHESSNIMRTMATKIKFAWGNGSAVIPLRVFKGIGELTFEQLSSLRHRGSFSTVALTFAKCCQLTQTNEASKELMDSDLLERWYEGTLRCISEQASITRRSAGIPTLMTSILSANSEIPVFGHVVMGLIDMARRPVELSEKDETKLLQVHAMNCLKEIFKSSALGKKPDAYISECLQLAADSLNSEVWAIRNCGLLLLRSIIDSLFGTSESKTFTEAGWDGRSIRLSYDRYPSLPELLLKLLDTSTSQSEPMKTPTIGAVESVFPALDIIRRAGPPPTHRDKIFAVVSKHLASRIWHVREIAARTICTLLLHDNWLSDVVTLVESLQQSENQVHGILLAVKFILERRLELHPLSASDGLLHIVSTLRNSTALSFFRSTHGEILAGYLEVENIIAEILLSQPVSGIETDRASSIKAITDNLFADHAAEEFAVLKRNYLCTSTDAPGVAALGNTIVRRAIYNATLLDDEVALQKVLRNIAALNTDIVLAALDALPIAWKNNSSLKSLSRVSKAYINLLSLSQNSEVCAYICYDLADLLDRMFASAEASEPKTAEHFSQLNLDVTDAVEELGSILRRNDSPSFSNSRIRISGFLFINETVSKGSYQISKEELDLRMKAWAHLLWEAESASNDFDTRRAGAAALYSFYNHPCMLESLLEDQCAIYPLLALYDTLNDDDDEIRDLSARTVSKLLQKSLVPLAAQVELVHYMKRLYGSGALFSWSAVCRMTGNNFHGPETGPPVLESAEAQFAKALKDDDSLFVEEEQNLFIDEVRETSLWANAFEEIELHSYRESDNNSVLEQPCAALTAWVAEGLWTMTGFLDKEDGPLGWTSRPAAFAVCMRILLSARAIIQRNKRVLTSGVSIQAPHVLVVDDITSALERFLSLGQEKNVHGSLLCVF